MQHFIEQHVVNNNTPSEIDGGRIPSKSNCYPTLKDKVEFWSFDCTVKETVWNQKVDHLEYKYLCALQGSGIIKW